MASGILNKKGKFTPPAGETNAKVYYITYTGDATETAVVFVDQADKKIYTNVLKTPHLLTFKDTQGQTLFTFDGSEDITFTSSSDTYTIKKSPTPSAGNIAEYVLTRNDEPVGARIEIPASTQVWEAGAGIGSVQTKGTGCAANGDASVAEGLNTIANSDFSHTEGHLTKTIIDTSDPDSHGQASHAEGSYTTAKGTAAHAEGSYTTASGVHSHAEGYYTDAMGNDSHAEGNHTHTNNFGEHAEGCFNVSHMNSATYGDALNTQHSVGIGDAEVDPEGRFIGAKNAVEIMQNGDQYVIGVGGYDGKDIENASTIQEVINAKANDADVIHKAGSETIPGKKIFNGGIEVGQTNYGSAKGTSLSTGSTSFQILTYTPVIELWAGSGRMNTGQKIEFRIGNVNNPGANIEYLGNKVISFKPTGVSYTNNLGSTAKPWTDLYLSGNISDGTNNISVADIVAKSTVVANPGSATTDLTSIGINGTNYTIKSVEIDVAPYKANSPIIKGISLNGVDYNIMPRDSHGSIIIGPASYTEGAYDNIIALTDDIGNFYNHEGSIYIGNGLSGGTGNTNAKQIIIGANAAMKTTTDAAVEGVVVGDSAVAGNTDTISIGHGTVNYLANTVSFDTPITSRSIQLESPHNIIFRGDKVSSTKTTVESYTDARYLDDLLPPAPTVTVANKYLRANSTGSGFEYAEIELPTNAVTTDEAQTITGIKKFVGNNRIVVSPGIAAGYNYSISSNSQSGALTLAYQQYSATSWNQLLSITPSIIAPGSTNTMNLGGNVNGTYYYWNNLYINGSIKRNVAHGTQQENVTITLPENSGQMVVAPAPTSADAAKVVRVNSTGTGFELAEGSSGTLDPETVCQAIENMTSAQKERVKAALGFVSGDEREY